ncbi:hypothetical protein Lalb_Chr03g0032781 [Lupinus albus]|uniref:Uncharacterized protein n=1 Tax=Lupinus albus TaxID=3870 RepID=A0A6A4QS98_LUPAL|nr:hypothetical protein Lalb_Chr03g0032781 [Lupinus albus]
MMYGDPQHHHQPVPEFHRGPPPPQMMRQLSAFSTNIAPEFHHYDGTLKYHM